MNTAPHIGPAGIKPGEFAYEFALSLSDCNLCHAEHGSLVVHPPQGKRVGTTNANLIHAAQGMLDALRLIACQSIGDDWTHEQAFAFIRETAKNAIRSLAT